MHKGSTRVHGAIYLCSKPHNLHHDHEILNLVLWWSWHNAKRLHSCSSLLIIGDITNLCLISIESPLLALVAILRYQLKTYFLMYQIERLSTNNNWNIIFIILTPNEGVFSSWCQLERTLVSHNVTYGMLIKTRDSIKLHKLQFTTSDPLDVECM